MGVNEVVKWASERESERASEREREREREAEMGRQRHRERVNVPSSTQAHPKTNQHNFKTYI